MTRFADYRPQVTGAVDRSVLVRDAGPADAPAIVGVDASREPQAPEALSRVEARLARRDAFTVLAEAGDLAVGTSSLTVWPVHADAPGGWYVTGITVLPEWRRRRVADRMLARLLERLDRTPADVWSVVNALNRASLDLHARHGFAEVRRAPRLAGIEFAGGRGVLLHRKPTVGGAVRPTAGL